MSRAAPEMPAMRTLEADRPLFAIGLRLLAMALLAASYAIGKLLTERGTNLVEILFYRQLFALPVAAGWVIATVGFALRPAAPMRAHATRTSLGLFGMLLNYGAVSLLPLAEATSIGFTMPIFATILAALFLREPTGIHRWSAVLVGFVGVVIMAHPESANFASTGLFVALAGALVTAVVSLVLRDLGRREKPAIIVFWFAFLSLPPMGLLMFWFAQAHDLTEWGLLLALGLTGGGAQLLMTAALRWGPVSMIVPMDYSQMVWATLAGWLFWMSWPSPATFAGAALIATSGLYIAWREHVRRSMPAVSPDKDRAGRSG